MKSEKDTNNIVEEFLISETASFLDQRQDRAETLHFFWPIIL